MISLRTRLRSILFVTNRFKTATIGFPTITLSQEHKLTPNIHSQNNISSRTRLLSNFIRHQLIQDGDYWFPNNNSKSRTQIGTNRFKTATIGFPTITLSQEHKLIRIFTLRQMLEQQKKIVPITKFTDLYLVFLSQSNRPKVPRKLVCTTNSPQQNS